MQTSKLVTVTVTIPELLGSQSLFQACHSYSSKPGTVTVTFLTSLLKTSQYVTITVTVTVIVTVTAFRSLDLKAVGAYRLVS